MTKQIRVLAAALAFAAALPSSAAVIWRGDFSTNDLSQWPGRETVDAASRLAVLPGGIGGEGPALRAIVKHGDDPISSSGNRNEVFYDGDDIRDGTERAYHWRTYWPDDYPARDIWQLFTQWHQFTGGGSPPLAFYAWGEEVRLGTRTGEVLWSTPLVRGTWHDFVFHVRWSADASKGFVELWYDGRIALPRTHLATAFSGQGVYLKQGLYRSDTVTVDQAVYHRGMTVGETVDDVWPSTVMALAPAPPPEGHVVAPGAGGDTGSDAQPAVDGPATLRVRAGCSAVETGAFALVGLTVCALARRRRLAPNRVRAR